VKLDVECEAALNLAKRAVPKGGKLEIRLLMAALCHATDLGQRIPKLTAYLPAPEPVRRRASTSEIPTVAPVKTILERLELHAEPVTAAELFVECARTDAGRRLLQESGFNDSEIESLVSSPVLAPHVAQPDADVAALAERMHDVAAALSERGDERSRELLERLKGLAKRVGLNLDGSPARAGQARADDWFPGLSPEHELHNLGNDFYKLSKFEEAVECYDMALELSPDLLETYFNRGLAFTRMTSYDRALADLDKVMELNPNLAEAWYTRGLIREYRQEYDQAMDNYRQALVVDPKYEKAQSQLEAALKKKEDYERHKPEDEADRKHEVARQKRLDEARDLLSLLNRVPAVPDVRDSTDGGWRGSEERRKAIEYLNRYGRLLTDSAVRPRGVVGADDVIRSLVRTLSKMKRRSVILVGHAGTGKTAVVQELAYRMATGHPSIPPRLRDYDVFEVSPVFLQADTKYRGEYEEKIRDLIQILTKCPKVIVFIDEMHSFLQSSVHDADDSYTEANQAFKKSLADGDITFVGCTTPSEYRHFIEPDAALARRFSLIRLDPPTRDATLDILRARIPKMERHYQPLRIPGAILERVVALTDEYLPGRFQPDKSIQLLDEACAFCATEQPPLAEVNEDVLMRALEDVIGRSIVRTQRLDEEGVFTRLQAKVKGQDEVLRQIARAVVAGLGEWTKRTGPRGVFLFAGPTGVGKTETAVTLAEILGGGREALVRVDCNTLQRMGGDSQVVVHRLLGVPAGLVGYARGQGGILSRIRDLPESVVLFDEFEKADPGVGKLLLQIIDDGRVEDVDGNMLDFRRSFVIFTTNAGSVYDPGIGFGREGKEEYAKPSIDSEGLKAALKNVALEEEFLGRITHVFLFQGLDRGAIRQILEDQLRSLRESAELRRLELSWDPDLISHLASQWQPRYGVRHLTTILRNRIVEHLNLADAQGELVGLSEIRLEVAKGASGAACAGAVGPTSRQRRGNALVIALG